MCKKYRPGLHGSALVVENKHERTYTIDAPGVGIHQEYTGRTDPSITAIWGYIFNSGRIGWWLGQFKRCRRIVRGGCRPDLAIDLELCMSFVSSLHLGCLGYSSAILDHNDTYLPTYVCYDEMNFHLCGYWDVHLRFRRRVFFR